jgi:fibrillarin-like rRNA methylase
VGSGAAPSQVADETTAARKLYIAKCAKCHKFYDPAKYSDEEWRKWMAKMSKKSKLTAEQSDMLSKYVDETFRQKKTN